MLEIYHLCEDAEILSTEKKNDLTFTCPEIIAGSEGAATLLLTVPRKRESVQHE